MIARRLDEVLAQTDPFDLALAVERRVRALSGAQIRALIHDALPRMSVYYVQEFERVQSIADEASLRSAFAQTLKSNLRAIPLFGSKFGESLLELTPTQGAVGFDESPQRSRRWMAAGVVGAALLAAAIAGGHYLSGARSLAASSATAEPLAVAAPVTPVPAAPQAHRAPRRHRRVQAFTKPARAYVPPPVAYTPATTPPTAAPAPVVVQTTPQPQRQKPRRVAEAHGRGSTLVVVPPHKPRDIDAAQTNGIDTTDMPEPYSDATPLPQETAVPVNAPRSVRLATPTPKPRKHGWLYRSVMHLDPFKPHPEGTP